MNTTCLKISGFTLAIALAAVSTASSAANYYKWVDAKGVTHYTKNPPPRTAAKAVSKIETHGWANSAPTPSSTSEPNQIPSEVVKAAEEAQKAAEQPKPVQIPQIPAGDIAK